MARTSNQENEVFRVSPSLNEERFPRLHIKRGENRRKLYFERISDLDRDSLNKRGYEVVLLAAIPRDTPQEERAYLKAKIQGIEERTISVDKEEIPILRMMYQHAGLLDKYQLGDDISQFDTSQSVDEQVSTLLDWGVSRHTTDQSTIHLVKKGAKK